MKLYFPYQDPIDCAKCFTPTDRKAQIQALKDAISLPSVENREWLDRCRVCYEYYDSGRLDPANWWSKHACLVRPDYVTPSFCLKNRREMGEKFPKKYPHFNDSRNSGAAKKKGA